MVKGVEDEVALDLGHRAADQGARHRLGGASGAARRIGGGGAHGLAFGRADRLEVDFGAGGQQYGAVNRVLKLAHVAPPWAARDEALRLNREGPRRHAIHVSVFLRKEGGELEDIGWPFAERRN